MTPLAAFFAYFIFPGFLFVGTLGLLLSWVERKVAARVQWRVGPPVWQPVADLVKLLGKETIVPDGAPRILFLGAPLIGLVGATLVAALVGVAGLWPHTSFVGDLVVVVYLLALPPLATVLAGSSSGNPLGAVGASREMTLYLGYELPFLIAVVTPVLRAHSVRLGDIVLFQQQHGAILYSLSGAIATVVALVAVQAKLSFAPFDIPEAEQEIMAGPLIEHSGVTLAAFRLTRAMLFAVMPALLVTLFWGGLGDLWAIPKLLLVVVLIILVKNTNPRLRLDQAVRLFWFILAPLAALALVLSFYHL